MSFSADQYVILVVEDDSSVAASLCGLLADEGYTVVGPACSVGDAFAAVADNRIDAALLDVRLGDDQRVFELVEALAALRKPFAFLSGYSRNLMPLKYRHHPHLEKPYPSSRVLELVTTILQQEAARR